MKLTGTFGWMGFLLVAACAPLSASAVISLQGSTFDIAGGGQFAARLSSNPSQVLAVYCIDFNNSVGSHDSLNVNVSTAGNLSDTRYGTTAQSAFTYQKAPDGASLGNAAQRYGEAAWLVSQYSLTLGANNGSKDIGIQNAIWDLLDVTGAHMTQGDYQSWLNKAAASGGLTSYTIYTSTSVANASGDGRYTAGAQELIFIGDGPTGNGGSDGDPSGTPEPRSAVLFGSGVLVIGLAAARRRKSFV